MKILQRQIVMNEKCFQLLKNNKNEFIYFVKSICKQAEIVESKTAEFYSNGILQHSKIKLRIKYGSTRFVDIEEGDWLLIRIGPLNDVSLVSVWPEHFNSEIYTKVDVIGLQNV